MDAVILSFDPNKKQSVICERKLYMRVVESDSVKSARKASCIRPVRERQKLMSELFIGRIKTECTWQAVLS